MNFTFNVTIPKDTPEATPHIEELSLSKGVIYDFQILSLSGTNGMVYCYLTDIYGNMVYPKNPGGRYKLWGQTIIGKYPACKYVLKGDRTILRFVGYSPGTDHNHTITVSFWIVKEEDLPFLEKATEREVAGFLSGLKEVKNV